MQRIKSKLYGANSDFIDLCSSESDEECIQGYQSATKLTTKGQSKIKSKAIPDRQSAINISCSRTCSTSFVLDSCELDDFPTVKKFSPYELNQDTEKVHPGLHNRMEDDTGSITYSKIKNDVSEIDFKIKNGGTKVLQAPQIARCMIETQSCRSELKGFGTRKRNYGDPMPYQKYFSSLPPLLVYQGTKKTKSIRTASSSSTTSHVAANQENSFQIRPKTLRTGLKRSPNFENGQQLTNPAFKAHGLKYGPKVILSTVPKVIKILSYDPFVINAASCSASSPPSDMDISSDEENAGKEINASATTVMNSNDPFNISLHGLKNVPFSSKVILSTVPKVIKILPYDPFVINAASCSASSPPSDMDISSDEENVGKEINASITTAMNSNDPFNISLVPSAKDITDRNMDMLLPQVVQEVCTTDILNDHPSSFIWGTSSNYDSNIVKNMCFDPFVICTALSDIMDISSDEESFVKQIYASATYVNTDDSSNTSLVSSVIDSINTDANILPKVVEEDCTSTTCLKDAVSGRGPLTPPSSDRNRGMTNKINGPPSERKDTMASQSKNKNICVDKRKIVETIELYNVLRKNSAISILDDTKVKEKEENVLMDSLDPEHIQFYEKSCSSTETDNLQFNISESDITKNNTFLSPKMSMASNSNKINLGSSPVEVLQVDVDDDDDDDVQFMGEIPGSCNSFEIKVDGINQVKKPKFIPRLPRKKSKPAERGNQPLLDENKPSSQEVSRFPKMKTNTKLGTTRKCKPGPTDPETRRWSYFTGPKLMPTYNKNKRLPEVSKETILEQERLLNESRNRVLLLQKAQNMFNPGDLNSLPENHWRWKDPFARLGLATNAPRNTIKKNYKKLALRYHPDKSKLPDTLKKFHAVKEAYENLVKRGSEV